MKRLITLFMILCCASAYGQGVRPEASGRIEPRWIKNPPVSSSPDVPFVVVPVYVDNFHAATDRSFHEMTKYLPRDWNVRTIENVVDSTINVQTTAGESSKRFEQHIILSGESEGAPIQLNCRRVSEYWKRNRSGTYEFHYLYQVAAPGQNGPYDYTATTTKYGGQGLWRSMIVPGWGQMHKGSYVKGGLILGGTAALAGGIIATESIRSSYAKKINMTHNVEEKKLFAKRTNQFSTVRNVCIGAAGALYLYNIIDAIVAPGAERIIVTKNGNSMYMNYSPTSVSLTF